MHFSEITRPQAELTLELFEYILLRISRYFIRDDYDLLAESEPVTSVGLELMRFHKHAQHHATAEAYLSGNTVSAYNKSMYTLEEMGVVRTLAGNLCRVVVPYRSLREHFSDGSLFSKELFERSVFHFYDCHEQQEWRDTTRGTGTGVSVRPGLRARFDEAGLLDPNWAWHGWSQLATQCVPQITTDDWNNTPLADVFFEQVYKPS